MGTASVHRVVPLALAATLSVHCDWSSSSNAGRPEEGPSTANTPDGVDAGAAVPNPDPGSGSPSACPGPTGGPTMVAQDVTVDQTWTAAGSPYVIANTSDFSIRAKLTLEPCAEVLIRPGIDVTLRDAGSIVGIGTARQPIHIGATTPGQPFQRIYTGAGSIKLAYTTIDGGGYSNSPTSTAASMIDAQGNGDDPVPQPLLDFDHVTVKGSATQGITLRSRASFSASSQSLTVTGSHYLPLRLSASSANGQRDHRGGRPRRGRHGREADRLHFGCSLAGAGRLAGHLFLGRCRSARPDRPRPCGVRGREERRPGRGLLFERPRKHRPQLRRDPLPRPGQPWVRDRDEHDRHTEPNQRH